VASFRFTLLDDFASGKTVGMIHMKILLAIDRSKFSEAAIQAVIARGRTKDTEVRVLHVVEPPWLLVVGDMGGYDPALEVAWDEERKQAQILVAKTAETLRSHGMNVTTSVQQGDSQSTIIDASEEWHADLIVMGSHRRNALSRFLKGNVSGVIARHAHCSVEIVRIPSRRGEKSVRNSKEFTLAVPECAVEHPA
jgi:nucleotide-binding universal stress UspA family protein